MVKMTIFLCYFLPNLLTEQPICGTLVYKELFNTIAECEELALDAVVRLRMEAFVKHVKVVGDMILTCGRMDSDPI